MPAKDIQKFILDNDIIGFFDKPITLKSGRTSHFYVNWRTATIDAFLLDQITDYLCAYIKELDFPWDSLYGVPEGASKTAMITALKLAKASEGFQKGSHVVSMGRGKVKEHGSADNKYFIGMPKGRTLVLEDTTTTGLSLIACIKDLQKAGVEVTAAIGMTDRMEKRDDGLSVEEALHKECGEHIKYIAITKATDLLPLAAQKVKPKESVREALTKEFEAYGVANIDWGH